MVWVLSDIKKGRVEAERTVFANHMFHNVTILWNMDGFDPEAFVSREGRLEGIIGKGPRFYYFAPLHGGLGDRPFWQVVDYQIKYMLRVIFPQ